MKLTILVGSPRAHKSNSQFLINSFLKGLFHTGGVEYRIAYLQRIRLTPKHLEYFRQADVILMWTPLYTDSMPGNVMHFIEQLAPLRGKCHHQKIGYFIQSGFPETVHSRALEAYFRKLTQRLGATYLGTVIKGGAEGLILRPAWTTKKVRKQVENLGAHFAENQEWNEKIRQKLAGQEHLNRSTLFFLRMLDALGLSNGYWKYLLKKNHAYEKRFAKPYAKLSETPV